MFQGFFDTCKAKGINVTLGEWRTLMKALDSGLCESNMTRFYYIARSILVKSETELDINQTIDKTCNNGGYLQIVMDRPRKNTVKLLLLMDSGGTMIPYC